VPYRPPDTPGTASYPFTDADGRYESVSIDRGRRGAVVGPDLVRVQTARSGDANDPRKVRRIKLLAARYNDETTLKFDVPAEGTDLADFELSWK
jgi:hypothetical protein